MLNYLNTNSSVISQDTFVEKFTDKNILVMGAGPSVNLVDWRNVGYDYITTTSFFYLNDEILNTPDIIHVTLTDLVDLDHTNLNEFLDRNLDCTIAFEPKPHPFYETVSFKNFNEKYKDRIVSYNTMYGKKEGVAGRLCYFVMQFSPRNLFYVGIDGWSKNKDKDPKNTFRTYLDGDPDDYPYQEFYESHQYFANNIHQASLQTGTRLHNLGEGFDFNCSTTYSKQHFPLTEDIKRRIKL